MIGVSTFQLKVTGHGKFQLLGRRRNNREDKIIGTLDMMDHEIEKRQVDYKKCMDAANEIQAKIVASDELDDNKALQEEWMRQLLLARGHRKRIDELQSEDHQETITYGDVLETWNLEKTETYENEQKEAFTRKQCMKLEEEVRGLQWDITNSSNWVKFKDRNTIIYDTQTCTNCYATVSSKEIFSKGVHKFEVTIKNTTSGGRQNPDTMFGVLPSDARINPTMKSTGNYITNAQNRGTALYIYNSNWIVYRVTSSMPFARQDPSWRGNGLREYKFGMVIDMKTEHENGKIIFYQGGLGGKELKLRTPILEIPSKVRVAVSTWYGNSEIIVNRCTRYTTGTQQLRSSLDDR
mmetsp:Transcript_17525/g.33253  ORF Transcript_17525/g.33253 Transcript_17525/m.33253 type:complete len:351 (-) Transcript_17525:137-1189(-)